jgi:hypothetical protein
MSSIQRAATVHTPAAMFPPPEYSQLAKIESSVRQVADLFEQLDDMERPTFIRTARLNATTVQQALAEASELFTSIPGDRSFDYRGTDGAAMLDSYLDEDQTMFLDYGTDEDVARFSAMRSDVTNGLREMGAQGGQTVYTASGSGDYWDATYVLVLNKTEQGYVAVAYETGRES